MQLGEAERSQCREMRNCSVLERQGKDGMRAGQKKAPTYELREPKTWHHHPRTAQAPSPQSPSLNL